MKFVVLASGKGLTLEALLSIQATGQLLPQVCALITDNPNSGARKIADRFKLPSGLVTLQDFSNFNLWDEALLACLNSFNPDFILLAGFLKKVGPLVLNKFHNRIINTHPSLLPKFGGKGMYGRKVHEAVLAAKEHTTGVTFHLLNERYDEGPILKQVEVPVMPGDTPALLEERVKAAERASLVEFLNNWS